MIRTTIRLDENLLREAKRAAADSGQTLTALIEDALRERLARRNQAQPRKRITLTTAPGRLVPGIDPDRIATVITDEEDALGPPFH